MKKKHKNHHKTRPRNASAATAIAPRPRSSWRPKRPRPAPPPTLESILAAVAGGGGAALSGSYLAAERGWDPRWVGAGLGILGTVGAMKLGGGWRLASMGAAAAGAGQAALALWDDEDYTGAKQKPRPPSDSSSSDGKTAGNDNKPTASSPAVARQARRGGEGLDRAFNRVRERLHRMYEDDDLDRFVEENAA
jgi:hypothetical protein